MPARYLTFSEVQTPIAFCLFSLTGAEGINKYSADPKVLIASRLHQFLDLSKDVAFDAKLVPNGVGKLKFAYPQYEAKSSDWKLCYRAGKEPVEAARAFATEWLRQLEGK